MANPQTIIRDGNGTQSVSYVLPPGLFQYIESVLVQVDNSGGPDVSPELSVATTNGVVMATKRQGDVIPAGDTGSATWALRLLDETRRGAAGLAWLHGIGFSQVGGGTLVGAGANSKSQFDAAWTNNHPDIFQDEYFGGPYPVGFTPLKSGMYGMWIASQWDLAAFDKLLGFGGVVTDSLVSGRNSNSATIYAFFLQANLSLFSPNFCTNKNNSAVAHNVGTSYMSAVYFGDS